MTGNELFLLRKTRLTKNIKRGKRNLSVPLSQIDIAKIVGRSLLTVLVWERDNKNIPEYAYILLKKYCAKKGVGI
jgi:hypothetical protein